MGLKDEMKHKLEQEKKASGSLKKSSELLGNVLNPDFLKNGKVKETKKITHKIFNAWVKREDVAKWNAYIQACSDIKTAEDLMANAINEYIANHSLAPDEIEHFNIVVKKELKKAAEDRKKAEEKYTIY